MTLEKLNMDEMDVNERRSYPCYTSLNIILSHLYNELYRIVLIAHSDDLIILVTENIGESSSKKSSVHNTYSLHDRHGSGDCDKRSVNNISVVDNTADDVTTIENTLSTGGNVGLDLLCTT